jgi:2-polyprenyl-3-methyl-5-hydroxy-6-metoxy-1,4-benzoquinol methylase
MSVDRSRFETLVTRIAACDPELAQVTRQIEASWGAPDGRDCELTEVVARTLESGIARGLFSVSSMVRGFRAFAHDFEERQVEFLYSGEYRAKDYGQVSRDVYQNDEYMHATYYPALLFSYLAAPNYRYLLRRLDETLVKWRTAEVARVLEVASGHGFLLLFALTQLPAAVGVGTDIAPAAARFATELQRVTGFAPERFQFAVTDVLATDAQEISGSFDAVICCELLEHVPEPRRFLSSIHQRLRPGGLLFASAAVRMDAVDHLTLFASTDEVRQMLVEMGFEVLDEMSVPFVTRRPVDAAHWSRLLDSPYTAATFVAHCRRVP